MVFDWANGLSGPRLAGSPTAIGRVRDRDIPIEEYQLQYENILDQAREENPEANLTEEQLQVYQDQAWERVVNVALLREEARRRGIGVDDDEVMQYIESTPPAELRNSPAFRRTAFEPRSTGRRSRIRTRRHVAAVRSDSRESAQKIRKGCGVFVTTRSSKRRTRGAGASAGRHAPGSDVLVPTRRSRRGR